MSEIRVGIVGLGFMGKTHLSAYHSARAAGFPVRVAAVADPRVDQPAAASAGNLNTGAEGGPDLSGVARHTDPRALIADPAIDLVSICTPTDTHARLAADALRAGKHVLVEKPVALTTGEIEGLIAEERRAGRRCLPAMVMRCWPGWAWLRDRIHDGAFGRLKALHLERLGSRPTWNAGFYADDSRTGGALTDLHIHDADFVYWCLGSPRAVRTTGSLEQVATLYRYDAHPRLTPGASISAIGGWSQHPAFGFRMRYLASFERATADFDLARGERPVLLHDEAGSRPVELPTLGAYDAEVRLALDVVRGHATPIATLSDALAVAQLLAQEREAL